MTEKARMLLVFHGLLFQSMLWHCTASACSIPFSVLALNLLVHRAWTQFSSPDYLARCVLAQWKSVEATWHRCWGGLALVSCGSYQHPWASGSCPLGSNPEGLGLLPGAWGTLFRRMLMGLKAFLELLGASEFQLCTQTHLKKALCHTHPVGGTYNKYQKHCGPFCPKEISFFSPAFQGQGHILDQIAPGFTRVTHR